MNEEKGSATTKVQVIPFEAVILTTTKPSRLCQLTNSWFPFEGNQLMNLHLIVDSEAKCQQLRDRMRSDPEFFSRVLLKTILWHPAWGPWGPVHELGGPLFLWCTRKYLKKTNVFSVYSPLTEFNSLNDE